jgi:site-specific DNA recombinase
LLDFARLMGIFEERGVSLVSVTQPLNTTDSLGRLTLNILLSFAQFERELIAERARDKMRAARRQRVLGCKISGCQIRGVEGFRRLARKRMNSRLSLSA